MPSDAELIARICQHDEQAFEMLSQRYRARAYRHVYTLLHDEGAAEDVMQEVFLRVWTHAEQWQGSESVQPWLWRIATNLALNHLRALSRRRLQSLENSTEPLDESDESSISSWLVDHAHPTPEIIAEQDERQHLLQQLVEALPEDKRAVVQLIYQYDLAPREVAQTLGIPEGTVRSRFHYAVKRLAQAWRDLQSEWEEQA